ncbi:MAG: hypothetical protein ABJB98_08240 [Actinomycetota bacterium]
MWKKLAIAGATGAVILGAGVAAVAETGDPPSPSPGNSASAHAKAPGLHDKHAGREHRGNVLHGEWVTSKDGKTETHDAVRGKVTAVSATSISVQAADGYSLTLTVTADTKVRLRPAGGTDKHAGTEGTIAQVKTGDTVLASGIKSGSAVIAKHVIDTGTG